MTIIIHEYLFYIMGRYSCIEANIKGSSCGTSDHSVTGGESIISLVTKMEGMRTPRRGLIRGRLQPGL